MRKLTALLLLLTMLIPGACYAETPVEEAPAETPALTLPWDLSPGPVPGEDNYITNEAGERIAYQDETVTVTIPPSQAYGESDPELVFTVDRAQVPDHIPLTVGVPLQLSNEQGQMDVTITEVTDEEITLDANHPLAGKELTFEIEIVSVN